MFESGNTREQAYLACSCFVGVVNGHSAMATIYYWQAGASQPSRLNGEIICPPPCACATIIHEIRKNGSERVCSLRAMGERSLSQQFPASTFLHAATTEELKVKGKYVSS